MSWINKVADALKRKNNEPTPPTAESTKTPRDKPEAPKQKKAASGKKKPEGDKRKYIACFDGLVDVAEQDGRPVFITVSGGDIQISEETVVKGKTLRPPPVSHTPFPLANADRVVAEYATRLQRSTAEANADLFEEVRTYLLGLSELPSEEHYDLCAAWILHTYRLEQLECSPILWLYAVPERGKTRTGKGIAMVSFRGLHVESLNSAYFLRVAEDWEGTLFIDVVDAWRRAEKADSVDILLQRFNKGVKVPRVLSPDKGPFEDIRFFNVFGPTILGTNRGVDATLESRSIQIIMPESSRLFDNCVTHGAAAQLREKLLAYRAHYVGRPLPGLKKPFTGRLGDIARPMCQIVQEVAPDRMPSFMSLLERIRKDRLASKSESFEASVLEAIAVLESETVNGTLPIKRITEQANAERPESRKLTPQRIGKVVKSMGLETRRAAKNGASVLVWEEEKLQKLLVKYGLEPMSESSETTVSTEADTDLTEVSEPAATIDLPF